MNEHSIDVWRFCVRGLHKLRTADKEVELGKRVTGEVSVFAGQLQTEH